MKRICLFLIVICFALFNSAAQERDTFEFDIVFTKQGQNRLGFCTPSLINPSPSNLKDQAEYYDASNPGKVDFDLGSPRTAANGNILISAEGEIGVFWLLYPDRDGNDDYTVDVYFTASDGTDVAESGMLSHEKNANYLLNYKVSVNGSEILSPVSLFDALSVSSVPYGSVSVDSCCIRFTENDVPVEGRLTAYKLDFSIDDAPYVPPETDTSGTSTGDETEGVRIGTYTGYIVVKLSMNG